MSYAESSVCIVILNWNGRLDTLVCLESVEKIAYPNYSVIVVDNGSVDDSVLAIRAAFPQVKLIETGANLGFSGGNNVGITRALELGADYVLLLNNDTVVEPGLLDAFVAAAKRFPDAGVFSAKIYFYAEPNRIWYAGARWSTKDGCFKQVGEGELDDGQRFAAACETDYACGCAFFVPAARLHEIGLLDDNFFLYFEETDWCYRARKAGYPSIYVPEAKLWHKVSVSFGGEGSPLALYFQTRNRLLWASRHAALPRRFAVYAASMRALLHRFVRPLLRARTGRSYSLKTWWWAMRMVWLDPSNRAYFMGVRDFWLRRFGNCPDAVRALAGEGSAKRLSADGAPASRQSDDALLPPH